MYIAVPEAMERRCIPPVSLGQEIPVTPEDLTPSVVLKWLRIQANRYADTAKRYADTAEKFSQAADVLESTVEPMSNLSAGQGVTPAPHTRLFAEEVKQMS